MSKDPRYLDRQKAIEYAKLLGTFGKIDRSKQYEGRVYSSEHLRRNDDLVFSKVRENRRKIELQNFMLWILGGLTVGQWALILVFVEKLIHR
jgi:hypothetical protein